MWELIAISNETDRVWRWRTESGKQIRLGRCPESGWATPWDMRISSEHADLFFEGESVRVVKLKSARNAIHYHNVSADAFTLRPGEEFRIGLTTFRLYEIESAPEVRARGGKSTDSSKRIGHPVDGGTTGHGRVALQSNLEAALELLDQVTPVEVVAEDRHVETVHKGDAHKSTTKTPNEFVELTPPPDSGTEAETLRREMESLQARLEQKILEQKLLEQKILEQKIAGQQQAESESRRWADEEQRWRLREAELRQEIEKARVEAETNVERYRVDAAAAISELATLRSQLEKSALGQAQAEAYVQRLIDEERQRANEAEQRHEAEATRRQELEAESQLRRQEAESLTQQVAELSRHIGEQAEVRRRIEEHAGDLKQQAGKIEERWAFEAQNLRSKLQELQEQADAKAEVAAQARRELEHVTTEEQQRLAQERDERLASQQAREAAEAEAAKRREELASLQGQFADMQLNWQQHRDAQRRAEEEAERWRCEAERLKESMKALEARVAESQSADTQQAATSKSALRKFPLRSRMSKDGEFDPYYRWLAIPPEEQPPDYYRLLGLARFESDVDIIEYAADRQMDFIRRQQSGKRAHLSQQLLNELSRARLCLRDPEKKKQYDAQLWAELEAVQPPTAASPSSAAQASQSLDGSAFREYSLLDYIAETRHGHVFKAAHRTLGRLVAITILSDAATHDPQLGLRFRLKAQALSRAQHPGLLKAYDAGHMESLSYLVTEYISGTHLVELLKQQSALAVEQAVGYVLQTAEALHYLHERGIVHRNVKPSNILLSRNGSIRLVGLGSALYQRDGSLVDATLVNGLQEPWPSGSLDYMPPEQAENGAAIDRTADIYSLGCTLFTLLTRRLLLPAPDAEAKKRAHREKPPPSLSRIRSDVSANLNNIYQRMVSKSPRDRFPNLADVLTAFRDCGFQVP